MGEASVSDDTDNEMIREDTGIKGTSDNANRDTPSKH